MAKWIFVSIVLVAVVTIAGLIYLMFTDEWTGMDKEDDPYQ